MWSDAFFTQSYPGKPGLPVGLLGGEKKEWQYPKPAVGPLSFTPYCTQGVPNVHQPKQSSASGRLSGCCSRVVWLQHTERVLLVAAHLLWTTTTRISARDFLNWFWCLHCTLLPTWCGCENAVVQTAAVDWGCVGSYRHVHIDLLSSRKVDCFAQRSKEVVWDFLDVL